MDRRERLVEGSSAALFAVAAVAIALLISSPREADPLLMIGLVLGHAAVSRVRFEFADVFVSAEQLVFIPMLILLPLEYIPLLVCAACLLSVLPEILSGSWHRHRAIHVVSESWYAVGPVLVLAIFGPETPTLHDWEIYLAAFAAEVLFDLGGGVVRDMLQTHPPLREILRGSFGTLQVDAILTPLAFLIGVTSIGEPVVLLSIGPLVWLLRVFSKDRRQRYSTTLELNRAYRGTVMLLADVVESDDGYTGEHSRSVVELVQAVTERMGVDHAARQEMEFAALLHDVGKISIPKDILNKPAKLTAEEFELMKTHTVEGQFLLDRVGGLLGRIGEIVRSCHERWDGQGYPDGLKGEEIPLAARIVFTCDAYNAMTTNRPYRAAMSREAALDELRANAGSQFDPAVVDILEAVIGQSEPQPRASEDVRVLLSEVRLSEQIGVSR